MEIHLFPWNDIRTPSSRVRCYNLATELKKRGIKCHVSEHFMPGSIDFHFPFALMGRIFDLSKTKRNDVVIVFKGTFQPLNPEIFLLMKKIIGYKLIFDFDDAIFLSGPKLSLAPISTKKMVQESDGVSAGCEFLYNYAKQYNDNTMLIRGNVEIEKYSISQNAGDKVILGWLGTPSNHKFLKTLKKPLKRLGSKYDNLEFRIITNIRKKHTIPEFTGIRTKLINWDINKVYMDLEYFDIGLIPLNDSDWERGKSGGKVLDYMAAGIPIVSSPVGPHKKIIQEGVNGFFANGEDEWVEKLELLIENEELRKKMGRSGRKIAGNEYSIEVFTDKYQKLIQGVTKHSGQIT